MGWLLFLFLHGETIRAQGETAAQSAKSDISDPGVNKAFADAVWGAVSDSIDKCVEVECDGN
jgi:hypothetical protein